MNKTETICVRPNEMRKTRRTVLDFNPDSGKYNQQTVINHTTYPVINTRKTGRNEKCPCGSEVKFKKCCLN